MIHWNSMAVVGVTVSLTEYLALASRDRDDLVLWSRAASQRSQDDLEIARQAAGKADL